MSDKVVLECKDVSRHFMIGQDKVPVLENLNLQVRSGDRLSIVGTSGSGKTTLLNVLAGLDYPNQGEVFMMEKSLRWLKDRELATLRNQCMGFVFQFHHLLPEFSALENVLMPCRIQRKTSKADQEYAIHLLENVGLQARLKHRTSELSGGERQRVAIARSLVNKPSFVLMDEPTGNLDEATSEQIQSLILTLNKQLSSSIIVVTHNQEWAGQYPRQFKLTKGQLLELT